ncbi:MAG: hypothetical protein HQL16_04880 [Candidatus Omnitrophica bacterium]|nr:hypothetical protein [Candidatus Omnitrophota bacterium]
MLSSSFITFFLSLALLASPCFAQSAAYGLSEIDYFSMKSSRLTVQAPQEDLWAEPVLSPDGKVSIYHPPAVVVDFLNNPNEETGRKYLNWNASRLSKIQKAQKVLEALSHQEKGPVSLSENGGIK